jgi:hypothetical protein
MRKTKTVQEEYTINGRFLQQGLLLSAQNGENGSGFLQKKMRFSARTVFCIELPGPGKLFPMTG